MFYLFELYIRATICLKVLGTILTLAKSGGEICKIRGLKWVSSPQNENSASNYSPPCCSNPIRLSFIFGTQIKIFLIKSVQWGDI